MLPHSLSIAVPEALINSAASVGSVLLLVFLFAREIANAAGERYHYVARMLGVAVIPLLISFLLVLASKMLLGIS